MSRSADRGALLGALQTELQNLETTCGEMERALMGRRWDVLEKAIADSRRITHALQNAFEAASPVRDAAFDETFFRRLRYVFAIRENQMARLRQYHDLVGERLQLLSRWRQALRSMGTPKAKSRLAKLDQLS